MLPIQRLQIRSLVSQLRSHMLCSAAKKVFKKKKNAIFKVHLAFYLNSFLRVFLWQLLDVLLIIFLLNINLQIDRVS